MKNWTTEDSVPVEIQEALTERDAMRSGYGGPVEIFIKKENGKITDWIVVIDDGSYYKHRAEYMLWTSKGICQAIWSDRYLKRACKQYMETGKVDRDPNYRT